MVIDLKNMFLGALFGIMIHQADSASVEHPVFPLQKKAVNVAALRERTALVRALSHEEIADWIVAKSSFEMIACPNCEYPGGRRDRRNYWRWKPERPDEVVCSHCSMRFPNEKYPCIQVQHTADPTGRVQEYLYWSRGKDDYRYYLPGKIDNCRKQFMEQQAGLLAELYAATGDAAVARQAGLILHRLATVYPHYNAQICRRKGSPQLLDIPNLEPPNGIQPVPGLARDQQGFRTKTHYPYWSNRRGDGWNGWFYSEIPVSLVLAYDRIAAGPALDQLSEEIEADVRQDIAAFFRATANVIRSYPIYMGNMDPTLIRGLATVGRVIGEPEFVHDAFRRAELILQHEFFADGNWRECAPSYHAQTVSGLRGCFAGPLHGYSDPPAYLHPETGRRFDRLNAAENLPALQEAVGALDDMRFPNGDTAAVHDTWAPTTRGKTPGTGDDAEAHSQLHWAMGHAILASGRGLQAVQAHLHFSGGYGHTHADTLNLILYGGGREMACDIGYTHTVLRPYACNSLAHNLVLVDGRDQRSHGDSPPADGHLLAWGSVPGGIQFCEADGTSAYPDLVRRYRRAVVLVPTPGDGAYVVDIFRISGGARHDWVWHGDADREEELICSPPLSPWDGSLMNPQATFYRWNGAEGEYGHNMIDGHNNSYGLFQNLARGQAQKTQTVTFKPQDGTPPLRTTVLVPGGADVYTGTLPSVRRARENSAEVYDFRMPAILLRREGIDLLSTFAALHQPMLTSTTDRAVMVEELPTEGPEGSLALLCTGPQFRDIHIFARSSDSVTTAHLTGETCTLTGRYGFARFTDGEPQLVSAVDAEHFAIGDLDVHGQPAIAARVTAVERQEAGDAHDALHLDRSLPRRSFKTDDRVIVGFGDGTTYALAPKEILNQQQTAVLRLRHRPGFSLTDDGTEAIHTHHPHRRMKGQVTLYIPTVLSWRR